MLAYLEEHPANEEFWHMTATICCAIYRAAGDKRCQPKDFLPKKPGSSQFSSAEALANKFRAVLGGMVDPDAPKKKDKRK